MYYSNFHFQLLQRYINAINHCVTNFDIMLKRIFVSIQIEISLMITYWKSAHEHTFVIRSILKIF